MPTCARTPSSICAGRIPPSAARRPGQHAEAARPHPVLCLLRGPGPAARRDHPQSLRAPRPLQPAPDLGELPGPVPGHQRRQRRPGHPRLQRRPVRRRSRSRPARRSPTRCAATSRTWPPTTTGRPTRRPTTPTAGRHKLIDVDILGHIFEQSITDLEKLRNELDGLTERLDRAEHTSRRKKEGAFYTPAFITRYIVEQALGGVLRDRFDALRRQHAEEAEGTARRVLADPRVYDLDALNGPQRAALVRFWEAWQDELATIRLLDPACGSGAFLIEAFDQLHNAYQQSNDRLEELRGTRTLFDLDRQILQNNLYGVDLNEEAIEICRLSLWIKTAQRGKVLTSLDHSIRVGNSVVADPAVHPRAFDWQAAFPEVFEQGGFDVVVGNPPYVRQEWISPYKPYLQQAYKAYHGMADLYVYFYELGMRLLKPGGRLSFVVTNKWMKAGYGEPLRRFFAEEAWVESVVDFGHAKQIFEDADVFPSIIVARKPDRRSGTRDHKGLRHPAGATPHRRPGHANRRRRVRRRTRPTDRRGLVA